MSNIKEKFTSAKTHVQKHRAKYAVAATLVVTAVVVKYRGQLGEVLAEGADQIEATTSDES